MRLQVLMARLGDCELDGEICEFGLKEVWRGRLVDTAIASVGTNLLTDLLLNSFRVIRLHGFAFV